MLATAGGVLLSIPIAFMAARNVVPLPVFYVGRAVIIVARSFHPVIVAILFVKAVGFGPFAGVLTLIVYSIGFVAKMLAERIEEIDFGQVEAMRAAGAPYLSTLFYAVFPQIMPRQIGLTIYQLELRTCAPPPSSGSSAPAASARRSPTPSGATTTTSPSPSPSSSSP